MCMWTALLDLLFPRRSLTGQEGEWVTDEEMKVLRTAPVRVDVRFAVQGIDCIVAAADYREVPLLRRAVHTFKYRRLPGVAWALATLLLEVLPVLRRSEETALCPVPLHWTRKFWRGFNQSEVLAELVSVRSGIPVRRLLTRRRRTLPQVGLDREGRKQNMVGAFRAVEEVPAHVILVDDVCTTGSTLAACAKALLMAGAKRVDALVLARD